MFCTISTVTRAEPGFTTCSKPHLLSLKRSSASSVGDTLNGGRQAECSENVQASGRSVVPIACRSDYRASGDYGDFPGIAVVRRRREPRRLLATMLTVREGNR